jgi:small membrane protein
MVALINIIVLLVGFFAISRAVLRWRGGSIRLAELFFWVGIWLFAILFALFPDILDKLSNVGGFRRGMDLVLSLSVLVMFYLIFRLYVRIDEQDQDITKLVREITISKVKKP